MIINIFDDFFRFVSSMNFSDSANVEGRRNENIASPSQQSSLPEDSK